MAYVTPAPGIGTIAPDPSWPAFVDFDLFDSGDVRLMLPDAGSGTDFPVGWSRWLKRVNPNSNALDFGVSGDNASLNGFWRKNHATGPFTGRPMLYGPPGLTVVGQMALLRVDAMGKWQMDKLVLGQNSPKSHRVINVTNPPPINPKGVDELFYFNPSAAGGPISMHMLSTWHWCPGSPISGGSGFPAGSHYPGYSITVMYVGPKVADQWVTIIPSGKYFPTAPTDPADIAWNNALPGQGFFPSNDAPYNRGYFHLTNPGDSFNIYFSQPGPFITAGTKLSLLPAFG